MSNFKKALLSGEFVNKVQEVTKGEQLNSPDILLNILSPMISYHKHQEKFYVVYLDAKNNILLIDPIFTGSLSGCSVYPREVIKNALELGAAALIIAHNHPSGDLIPSSSDKNITKLIMIAADVHGIQLHDHLIVNETDYYSFSQTGIISAIKENWESYKNEAEVYFE